MKRWLFSLLFVAIVTFAPWRSRADEINPRSSEESTGETSKLQDQPQEEPSVEAFPVNTEWFAFQLGFGRYIGAVAMDLFTLRWHYLYLEILHFRMTGFISVGALEFGSVVGTPFRLDAVGRHEIRVGTGVGMSMFIRGEEGKFVGFGLMPQISYLYRKRAHFAWEFTVSVHFAVAGEHYEAVVSNPSHPPPCPIFVVGFRT